MWTYFLQSKLGGPIKIGKTRTGIERRLSTLDTGSPFELRIVGAVHSDIEAELHKRFSGQRIRKEWFSISQELIDFIVENCDERYRGFEIVTKDVTVECAPIESLFAIRKTFAEWTCDVVIENDSDIYDKLLDGVNWPDEGDEEDGVFACIEDMVNLIDGLSFVERVGVNTSNGFVLFCCGSMNSKRRFGVLEDLAEIAHYIDGLTDELSFHATFFDCSRMVWVDLLQLHIVRNIAKTEDPNSCFLDVDTVLNELRVNYRKQ